MDLFLPQTIEEAVGLLAQHEGARCISGGATLVAMMNAGLVEPSALISLRQIAGLAGISREPDGALRIGAMTRHVDTATSELFKDGQRVVPYAAARIANRVVRNMGTMGGSISFADPAADYLAALTAAGAAIETASPRGERTLPVSAFVTDWYTTALASDEIVTSISVPAMPAGSIGHYEKLARVSGDFAIVSIAIVAQFENDICSFLRVAVGGCGPAPLRLREAEMVLEGSRLNASLIGEAGRMLVAISDPVDDVRASSEYRRKVLPRLLAKALIQIQQTQHAEVA
jgi:aerobic carbon-monoxide dehydrogenase medium subunit